MTKPASVGLSAEGVVIRPLSDPSLSFETCLIMRTDDDSRLANEFGRSINRNVLYTDGAQHVAEHGGAYWLLDEIAIIQPYSKAVAAEEFQVWKPPYVPTEPRRLHATMAMATSCSPRRLDTPISRWTKSRCISLAT